MNHELLQKAQFTSFAKAIEAAAEGKEDDARMHMGAVAALTSMAEAAEDKPTVDAAEFDAETSRLFADAVSIDVIRRAAPQYANTAEAHIQTKATAIKGITNRRDKIMMIMSLAQDAALSAMVQNPMPMLNSLIGILPDLADAVGGEE